MNESTQTRFGDYFEPTEVSQEARQGVIKAVCDELAGGRASTGNPSSELQRMVKARVRLADFKPYLVADRLIALSAAEIDDLGGRVHAYQYVERYRFAFQGFSQEMSSSFIRHTYEMRQNEVYAIKERAVKLLALLREVGSHFSIEATSQTKNFTGKFDKLMEYRLRERHKMTHFHEAPSMTGRMLEVTGMLSRAPESQKKQMIEVLAATMAKLSEAASTLGVESDPKEFRRKYLLAVDAEAADMWKNIEVHIRLTLGLVTSPPGV